MSGVKPMKKSFIRGIATGVCVSILVSLLSFMGFLRSWENGVFDFLMWWQEEKRSTNVFLVEIDDRDYEALFNSTSPLSRTILAELLLKLARTGPAVIAADIDLGGKTPDDGHLIDALKDISKRKIPVVLPSEISDRIGGSSRAVSIIPRYPFDTPEGIYSGAVNFPISKDGVVREMLTSQSTTSGNVYPFFCLSVLAAFKGIPSEEFREALESPRKKALARPFNRELGQVLRVVHDSPVQKIRYIGNRKSFNSIRASSLLSMPQDSFPPRNILSGKILLLGGTFTLSKDFYRTPKGPMSGVEIIANSVETLLADRPLKAINHFLEFLFELVIALILSCFFVWFSEFRATMVSLLSILPLSVLGSLVAFYNFDRWLNFIPVGVAIVLHGQWSFLEHFSQLKRDVERLQNQVAEGGHEIPVSDMEGTAGSQEEEPKEHL